MSSCAKTARDFYFASTIGDTEGERMSDDKYLRQWACKCGGVFQLTGCDEKTWSRLLAIYQAQHRGDGHGECDLATARRARAEAERREQNQP